MGHYRRQCARVIAVVMTVITMLSGTYETVLAEEVQDAAQIFAEEEGDAGGRAGAADIETIEGGIDISKYGNRLEGEYHNTSGDFSSYHVESGVEGETGYVEWTKQDWGNAKWTFYLSKAGEYKVSAQIRPEEAGTLVCGIGNSIGKNNDGNVEIIDPQEKFVTLSASEEYQTVEIYDTFIAEEPGIYYLKIMDTTEKWQSGQLNAKLDYLEFQLTKEYIPDTPDPDDQEVTDAKKIYQDPEKATEERMNALLGVMTLEEKAAQMVQAEQGNGGGSSKGNRPATPKLVKEKGIGSVFSGGGSAPKSGNSAIDWENRVNEFKSAALESRLGIPIIYGVDAVHGHNNVGNAVIFPHNIGLGAANDKNLTRNVGEAAAEEIAATGIRWSFAPTLGVPDSEQWGRFYECFSEDAGIVSDMGAAYVEGLQEKGVAATAKHYIGEGQTDNGVNQGNVTSEDFDQMMAEKRLLEPYKAAIDAGAYTVMASYNSVNDVKCHANQHLLTEVLKGQLGFKGFVVSDYNGVDQITADSYEEKVVQSVNAGVDMFMEPYDWENCMDAIVAGINSGSITEERLDDAVSRILWAKFEMGLFEEEVASEEENRLMNEFGGEGHRAAAKEAAEKTLTVLKNDKVEKDGKTALDLLDDADITKITVAGHKANDIGAQCGGWTISWQGGLDRNNSAGNVNPSGGNKVTEGTTILEGFIEKAGKKVDYNARGKVSSEADAAVVVVGGGSLRRVKWRQSCFRSDFAVRRSEGNGHSTGDKRRHAGNPGSDDWQAGCDCRLCR